MNLLHSHTRKLPPFKIITCFGFYRYIIFIMYLDIIAKNLNLEKSKRLIIWNKKSIINPLELIWMRSYISSFYVR